MYGAGAGAVTRLAKWRGGEVRADKIKRIINPKYPYEYLRDEVSTEEYEKRLFDAEMSFAAQENDKV